MFKNISSEIHFFLGILVGLVICLIITYSTSFANATAESKLSLLSYPIYLNGQKIILNDAFIKDNKTYIQLREVCSKMNVSVNWVDPNTHMLPIPGGNLPDGINLTNPTFVYTSDVTNYYDTSKKINCVEITGIYEKYKPNNNLKYAFGDDGLIINVDGTQNIIPLKYNPYNGRMYLQVGKFREKIQPYLVDICMQV